MAWDKTPSMKDSVRAFLVNDKATGKTDLEASVSKFREAALRHLASQEAEDGLIQACLTHLFDTYPGATLNMDFIKSQTVQRMGKEVPALGDPTLFLTLAARVEATLQENTNQPASEATDKRQAQPEITGRTYSKRMGKGGGWSRVSDQSPAK